MLLILISSFLLNSCKENTRENNSSIESNTSADLEEEKDIYRDRDTVMTYQIYNNEEEICKNWVKTKKDILGFVMRFTEITNYEWHQCYGTYECGVKGELFYNKVLYKYNLNAGGWMHLASDKTEKWIATKNSLDSLKFLSVNFCEEDWD